MSDHKTLAMIGFFLVLAVTFIGCVVAYKHHDTLFPDKPEPALPWTRWDVVLNVFLGLSLLVPIVVAHHQRLVFVPYIATSVVICARSYYRRRKAKQARRNAEGGDP